MPFVVFGISALIKAMDTAAQPFQIGQKLAAQETSILDLPQAVKEEIFKNLPKSDIASVRVLCRELCNVCDQQWKRKFTRKDIKRMFPGHTLEEDIVLLNQKFDSRFQIDLELVAYGGHILPNEISKLEALSGLILYNNRLGPEDIRYVSTLAPHLKKLELGQNDLEEIPEKISFPQLQILWVYANPCLRLPAVRNLFTWVMPKISMLSLSHNRLTELPSNTSNFLQLKELDLFSNNFNVEEFKNVCMRLSNLEKLSMGSNQLTSVPDEITNLTLLKELSLYQNRLSLAAIVIICQLQKLEKLDLSWNDLTDLPGEMNQLVHLRILLLTGNNFTPAAIKTLSLVLRPVRKLDLGCCGLTSSAIAPLGQLPTLQDLDLSQNQLTKLPDAICRMSTLAQLNLVANRLKDLPKGISQLTQLTTIKLWCNDFSPEVKKAIRQRLPHADIYFCREGIDSE